MEIDLNNTVHVGFVFGAFVLGFTLPLVSYFIALFMIGNDLRRILWDVRDILSDVGTSTGRVEFSFEEFKSDFRRMKRKSLETGEDLPSNSAASTGYESSSGLPTRSSSGAYPPKLPKELS